MTSTSASGSKQRKSNRPRSYYEIPIVEWINIARANATQLMRKLPVLMLIVLFACESRKTDDVEVIINRIFQTNIISSGSALAVLHDTAYIVGDDAEYIAGFLLKDSSFRRISLYPSASFNRIDRSVKHDLESGVLLQEGDNNYLIAFGSGGVSPYRDTLFALDVNDTSRNFRRSLSPLFQAIKVRCGLKDNELNIEGAALTSNKLLLFNRGKNFIFSIFRSDFTRFLQSDTSYIPPFDTTEVALPVIDGYPVGFSGACTLEDDKIIFTASLEETLDFTKDGAVKGSYIGQLRIESDNKVKVEFLNQLKDKAGKVLPDKLESIEIVSKQENEVKAIAVADNDNGSSRLYDLTIALP